MRHGIGEYRYSNGDIYKGSWANEDKSGIGLYWTAKGDLSYGTYKEDKNDGLHIIHQ
jgi:hypothetical protein